VGSYKSASMMQWCPVASLVPSRSENGFEGSRYAQEVPDKFLGKVAAQMHGDLVVICEIDVVDLEIHNIPSFLDVLSRL
jgi:hypothetical protein